MQALNFNQKKEKSKLDKKNQRLADLLREQQLYILEGNDHMAEVIGMAIAKLNDQLKEKE